MLKLFNTLTKRKEDFRPIKRGQVGMYNCGPTVYDYVHIGNLRAYVFADILRRTLKWNGYAVRQVMNITDFGHLVSDADNGEDKMLKGLKREGKPITLQAMRELADKYAKSFNEDLGALNILTPTVMPYASEHIPEQIDIIKGLAETQSKDAKGHRHMGFIYTNDDGVYFDTSRYQEYGKLGGLSDLDSAESRLSYNSNKKNPRDFALWKFNSELGWNSPWGKGFPGWHLECSAMSMKYLGDHFDIHTGGIDHIPIHHNNEIAQSENFTGKTFVNYWLHNEFITIDDDKMAKSTGSFITRRDLESKGFEPLSYRYWLLTAHYRSQIDFSWKALKSAQNAFHKLQARISEIEVSMSNPDENYIERFTDALNDDLNTPTALATLWDMLKDTIINDATKKATALKFDEVLGLGFETLEKTEIPESVRKLLKERDYARSSEDWHESDKLRDEIEKLGYIVKDTDDGSKVSKK